ncbi:hypothetical protein ACFQZ4_29725 [Catellatospora coxensis]
MRTAPRAAIAPTAPAQVRPAAPPRIPFDQLWRPYADCGRQCGCDGGRRSAGRAGCCGPWRAGWCCCSGCCCRGGPT